MNDGRRVQAHHRRALGIPLVVLSVAAAGCGQVDRMTGEYVYNYTGTPVTISYVDRGQTRQMSVPIAAGAVATLGSFDGGCSDGLLLAADPSGREVARLDTPLCAGDSWEIGTRPTASP
jgi:hypothetical protein